MTARRERIGQHIGPQRAAFLCTETSEASAAGERAVFAATGHADPVPREPSHCGPSSSRLSPSGEAVREAVHGFIGCAISVLPVVAEVAKRRGCQMNVGVAAFRMARERRE